MKLNLKNHPIWQEIEDILAHIDDNAIANKHLEDCNYTVNGYWDESEFYEEITFIGLPCTELASSFLGITAGELENSHWIKLKFLLKADTSSESDKVISDIDKRIGELTIILDSNLEFVDENWLIDVKSPFVVAKRGQDLNQKLLQV